MEFHCGELFPRVGFIVTNLETPSRTVVRFYNKRGTAEQWIKEGKQAVKMTRLSCHRFRSNQVRLALSLLAYNLGNLWRRLALPKRIENWSLTSLQQRLVKTGGRLVKHARYYWLLVGGEPSDEAAVWEYGAADRGAARGKRVQDSSKVRMIVNRLQGIVLCPNPWSLHVSEQTGEQRRCQSSNHAVEGSKEVISLSSQLV